MTSGIEGLGEGGTFVRFAVQALGETTSFKLVDVGCAGGLAPGWRVFGDRLAALGIDGHGDEIARLIATETNPQVHYQAGLVGLPPWHPLAQKIKGKGYWHHWASARLSWERIHHLRRSRAAGRPDDTLNEYYREAVLGQNWGTFPQKGFDLDYAAAFESAPFDPPKDAASTVIHLPEAIRNGGMEDLDFFKLDIDGPDYVVLRSINDLLDQPDLIGVAIEVSFFGSHDANDNTFHNVDRLMRQKGFDLFALSKRTYTSAALPWPFADDEPGKAIGGRPGQGDAIYLRDFGSRVRTAEAAVVSDAKLLKAAILLSMMNLHDWAAELILVHRQRLANLLDVDAALDLLAQDIQPGHSRPLGFAEYTASFEREDPRFFGAAYPVAEVAPPAAVSPNAAQSERIAALEIQLEHMKSSTSWRLTKPMRWMASLFRHPAR